MLRGDLATQDASRRELEEISRRQIGELTRRMGLDEQGARPVSKRAGCPVPVKLSDILVFPVLL